jgi:DNA-binding CsgD family transcriptional regulator
MVPELTALVDRFETEAFLVSASGSLLHANASARRLLADATMSPHLHAALRLRAAELVRSGERRSTASRTARALRSARMTNVPPLAGATVRTEHGPAVLLFLGAPRSGLEWITLVQSRTGLTRRQAEIAVWLADGASTVELAQRGGISHATVRRHLEAIFQRTHCHTRSQLAALITRLQHE